MFTPPLNFSLAFEKFLMNWRVNHMVEAYAQQGLADKLFESRGKYCRSSFFQKKLSSQLNIALF